MERRLKFIIQSLFFIIVTVPLFISCSDDDSTDGKSDLVIETEIVSSGIQLENVYLYRKNGLSDGTNTSYNYFIEYQGTEMRIYNQYMLNLDVLFGSDLDGEVKVNAKGDVILMKQNIGEVTYNSEKQFRLLFIEKAK